MKKIFEFEDPQDNDSYEVFSNAYKMHAILCDLRHELRDINKYGKPTKQDKHWDERLCNLLVEYNVEL